jgi:hypothetical protein
MSTPVVSGIAALLWALPRHPQLTNIELRQLLAESALDLGAPGRDDSFGSGRIDARRALAQDRPRARCGDGKVDRESELCDPGSDPGVSCQSRGYDPLPGRRVVCNSGCSGLDDSGCGCLPGPVPYAVTVDLLRGYESSGQRGTLVFYHLSVAGQPQPGVIAQATVSPHGVPSPAPGTTRTLRSGPSPTSGLLPQFFSERGTGLAPGDYDVSVTLTEPGGHCHAPQPLPPFPLHIES